MIHITALENDYYHFDPVNHRLTGERGGETFRLGDPIRVRLAAVNLDERKIDFLLDGGAGGGGRKRKGRRGASRKKRR